MEQKQCLTGPGKKIKMSDADFGKKRKLNMEGPDGGWAWLVALSICLINLIFAGIARMSGILFVAFINTFSIHREEAALPSSIRSSMKNLLGPAVGILGQHYGVRAVTLAGGVVATISAASCYFATNMTLIIALWGCLNGIGVALTVNLLQVVIGQHFKVHHSTASGLAFSGGCVGSFIFPVIIEYLLNTYGLQGTFLIMSGVIMHSLPAALMLRKPVWLKSSNSIKNKDTVTFNKISESENDSDKKNLEQEAAVNEKCYQADRSFYWFKHDRNSVAEIVSRLVCLLDIEKELVDVMKIIVKSDKVSNRKRTETNGQLITELVAYILNEMYQCIEKPNCKTFQEGNNNSGLEKQEKNSNELNARYYFLQRMEELVDSALHKECNRLLAALPEHLKHENNVKNALLEVREVCQLNRQAISSINSEYQRKDVVVKIERRNKFKKSFVMKKSVKLPEVTSVRKAGFKEHIKTAIMLNKNPIFLLICVCRTVHFITFIPFVTVVVDFSKDKGLPEDYGKYVLAALSAGDLVGRLGFGWVTDRQLLSLPKYMLFVMVAQGITTAALPLVESKYPLMTMIALFGMLVGSVFIRHPVLISKYMSTKEKSIAMGSINFFAGVIGFALPAYIGYFRDTLGSYDCMFYITGGITSCAGLLWLFEPQLVKYSPVKDDDEATQTPPVEDP